MSRYAGRIDYIVNGDMTAAAINGPWIRIRDMDSLSFKGKWSGASATTGSFDVQVTDDDDPINRPSASPGPQAITRTAEMTAANPAGGTSGSFVFALGTGEGTGQMPRGKWARLIYTRTSGGNANALNVSFEARGT